jgi:hypothetical protein
MQLRSDGQSRLSLPLGELTVAAGTEQAVPLDLPALVQALAPLPAAAESGPPQPAEKP